jgi:hypothetical protein
LEEFAKVGAQVGPLLLFLRDILSFVGQRLLAAQAFFFDARQIVLQASLLFGEPVEFLFIHLALFHGLLFKGILLRNEKLQTVADFFELGLHLLTLRLFYLHLLFGPVKGKDAYRQAEDRKKE